MSYLQSSVKIEPVANLLMIFKKQEDVPMNDSLNTSDTALEGVSEKKLGRLKDLLTPILRRNLKTEDQAQALIEAPSFVEGFERLVKELVGKLTDTFMVTVDYRRSFAEMVKAGNYDYASDDITFENFPLSGEGTVDLEIVLVHFNRNIESDDAIKELGSLGLRPAVLPELLAFGETHTEVQREFPIIALGSVWTNSNGDRYIPCLDLFDDERELDIYWFDCKWTDRYRFATVRK